MSLCPHGYSANWDCPECACPCGAGRAEECMPGRNCRLDERGDQPADRRFAGDATFKSQAVQALLADAPEPPSFLGELTASAALALLAIGGFVALHIA